MAEFANPFRPGAGHRPPYLAGREEERQEFGRLLEQRTIVENLVLTGLRGVGKTALLESFKSLALKSGWLWLGADLSESTSISENNMAIRLCTDLSTITSSIVVDTRQIRVPGFSAGRRTVEHTLDYEALRHIYDHTPGLSLDKIKSVLQTAWQALSRSRPIRGVVFAYDEAQNLADQAAKEEYPLSLMLDAFQSLQRQDMPLMLVLTGLPMLFSKLVDARTFAERMFRVVFLDRLNARDSEDAVRKPLEDVECPVRLGDESVEEIVKMSAGYPYFIQFIGREVYDLFIQRLDKGERASVPVVELERKLDMDFFAGRLGPTTSRQRELLAVIAELEHDNEFTVKEVVEQSRHAPGRPFSSSHVNQMLAALASQGIVFKNRYGRYSFAVPMLGGYIRRHRRGVD